MAVAPKVRVVIVDYDPEWPRRFEEERARIVEALGELSVTVVHIGSTSVPSLGAKPIIDMMLGVQGKDKADWVQKALEEIGYTDVTVQPENPDWFYCLGYGAPGLYHHLHLVVEGSSRWRRQLAFRDYLRANPEAADEYNMLKRRLADQYGEDRVGYTDAKTVFIEGVIRKLGLSP